MLNRMKVQKEHANAVSEGYVGCRYDEERSKLRYPMRNAEFREAFELWTHNALSVAEYGCVNDDVLYEKPECLLLS